MLTIEGTSNQPLYRSVADYVETLIEEGTLGAGNRIPSLRRLSRQLEVSLSTVKEAYHLLEDRGLLEVRPQSGHYVRLTARDAPPVPARTSSCQVSAPLDSAEWIERLVKEASGPNLGVAFGLGVPHPEFLPTQRLRILLARSLRRDPAAGQSYDSLQGNEELRSEIARRSLDAGCAFAPDDIVITTGAQEAISLALRAVTRPGDTVAIESPTYYGFLQVLESLHLQAREIATDPVEGICIDSLEEAVAEGGVAACLVVASFGNPLGHSMPDPKRRRLVETLAAAEVPLIEDDTYGEVPFGEHRPRALKSHDRDGGVLMLSSFSKTLAPGFRVGWIAPGRFRKQVLMHKFANTLATATPTQAAIAEFLASGGLDRHLRQLRRRLKDLVRRMIRAVGEAFPDGTRVSRPSGGYLIWVEMPEQISALELYQNALEEGISIIPGPVFSASGRYRNCFRISCAVTWTAEVERAVKRLGLLAAQQLRA